MKKTINKVYASAAFVAAFALLFLAGCSKEPTVPGTSHAPVGPEMTQITDKPTQQRIVEVLSKHAPKFAVFNEPRGEYILIEFNQDGPKFDFASPSGGFSFSGPQGNFEFVQAADGSFYQIITPGGSGGTGGGTVAAGGSVLDITMVMCFNSGEDSFGGLFDAGGFTGFSGAVGIAGDFEALMNGEVDGETDFLEYFHGIVAFYAFDGTASGSYPVVDFFEASEDDAYDTLDGKAVAYFWSFAGDGGIFFSKSGSVDFSGNSVEFNGNYWGITGFDLFFENEVESIEYVEVPGFGALFCM